MKRLADVDDMLEELGTLRIYRKLQIRIKRTLIGWLVYTQIVNISDVTWFFLQCREFMVHDYALYYESYSKCQHVYGFSIYNLFMVCIKFKIFVYTH